LDHQTEALGYRNLPFDTKADLSSLLLHYLDEFQGNKLKTITLALKYTILIIQPTCVNGIVVLPRLRLGVKLTDLARLHAWWVSRMYFRFSIRWDGQIFSWGRPGEKC